MSLSQLFRREFLLKVLITIGMVRLKNLTGLSEAHIENLVMGHSKITTVEIESIYRALTKGA
ncbi:hypothetical protein [Acinetobacter pittii]|uniref:hypothetical protein n=1 Tax=Acinetobacter pittii TaxID=48296 RepID=UPI001580BCCD|nr:hypothetical protein [Acinetobacter pittii]NUF45345.1 hypothetical protein [Acinetobacter pittii]